MEDRCHRHFANFGGEIPDTALHGGVIRDERPKLVPEFDRPRYRTISRVGSGGMGEVFLAIMECPGGVSRPVVLKRLWPVIGRAVTLAPNNLELVATLAQVRFELARYEEALVFAQRAVRLDPGEVKYRLLLSDVYRKLALNAAAATDRIQPRPLPAARKTAEREDPFEDDISGAPVELKIPQPPGR